MFPVKALFLSFLSKAFFEKMNTMHICTKAAYKICKNASAMAICLYQFYTVVLNRSYGKLFLIEVLARKAVEVGRLKMCFLEQTNLDSNISLAPF